MQKGIKGWVALILGLGACGGIAGTPTVGGESHFLRHCFEGCGDLSCVADLCTRSCLVAKDSCGDLIPDATCTNASVEPGSVAVCDLACETSADCSKLGAGFACTGGFCRSTAVDPGPSGEAGMPGTSGSGGTTSSGGSSNAGGTSAGANTGGGASQVPDFCALPFDAGPCKASVPVFTLQNGQCVKATYGGCEGNENRFSTIEQCMATCLAQPGQQACADGRVAKEVCIQCGPAGGCGLTMNVCSQPCDAQTQCDSPYFMCFDGTCQVYGCE